MSKHLDLNTATEQDLSGIQGVGKDKAKKIVDYRKHNGPFKSWGDLLHVPGMPISMLDTLEHHGFTVGNKAA